jgi:hypothetical protein
MEAMFSCLIATYVAFLSEQASRPKLRTMINGYVGLLGLIEVSPNPPQP